MKQHLLVFSSLLVLASCSTAYKSGQTPDDVYFSPSRQPRPERTEERRDEYARVEKQNDRMYRSSEEEREDRYLRMKTSYRRYSILDDCDCYCNHGSNYYGYYDYYRVNDWRYYNRYSPLVWSYNPYYYNPYYYNPYYASPYYSGHVAGNFRPVYNKPRGANVYGYDGNNSSNYGSGTNAKGYNGYSGSSNNSNENYRGSGNNAGGFLRNVFGSGSSSSNTSSSSTNASSGSSSSSSSSGSSSSGSSRAPVRKF